MVTVTPDGKNAWAQSLLLRSTCILDVSYFPYDDQRCKIKFGSWSNDASRIDLNETDPLEVGESYLPNGQWKLLRVKLERNHVKYACCPNPYADVTMTIDIRRATETYTMNIVVPSALLSALALLTFLLPPESGERVSLCITVLLAVTVFQQLTAQMMPEYGMPYLGQYYFATTIVTAVSLISTTLIINMYHRNTRRMPKLMRIIVLDFLGRALLCKKPDPDIYVEEVNPQGLQNGIALTAKMVEGSVMACDPEKRLLSVSSTDSMMLNVNDPLEKVTAAREKRAAKTREEEWFQAAKILDRFFMVTFSLILIVTFFVVFMRAPRFLGKDYYE